METVRGCIGLTHLKFLVKVHRAPHLLRYQMSVRMRKYGT